MDRSGQARDAVSAWRKPRFTRITYTEAIDKLLEVQAKRSSIPVKWGIDLQSEHERFLTEKVYNNPVIITDYPKEIKAFYMKQNDDGKTVRAMDVLVPRIGEIIGGSEREDDYDTLIERISELGLDPKRTTGGTSTSQVRQRAPRGIRPRVRAAHPVRHRHAEHPRRDPFPRTPKNAAF